MVALFFVPVVVVVVVAIAERKRESACEKEKQVRGIFIQTERRKREKGTLAKTTKTKKAHKNSSPFPPRLFVLSFVLSFVFPKLTNANEPKSTNEKKNKNEGSSVAKSNRRVGTAFKRSGRESERTRCNFFRRSTHDDDDDDDEKGGEEKSARKWAL
jgi:hypothetical protein